MHDLRTWLAAVEAAGSLQRISAPVDWDEEIGAINYLVATREGAPALLFEHIVGHPGWRVLSNQIGSSLDRLALTLGLPTGLRPIELIAATRERVGRRLAAQAVEAAAAPVMENAWRGDEVDLTTVPAPRFWPRDGGRYIGSGTIVVTRHPETGTINLGTYRQMLHGPREVGLYISPGKDGLQHLNAAWRRGEPLPVVAGVGCGSSLRLRSCRSFSKVRGGKRSRRSAIRMS